MKKIMIALALALCVFLSGCGITPDPPNKVVYRALLVGIENGMYNDSMNLPVAGYNVKRLEEIFSACKFTGSKIEFSSIDVLRGNDPTKEVILESILSIFEEADENDINYFYFMGHGGMRDGHPIFCPTDYNGQMESAIKLEELEAIFDTIQGTKILFLESCHSGNFIEKNFNTKVINTFYTKAFNKDSYQVMTSCTSKQFSWYYGSMSYFTMGLCQGCKNLNADYDGNEAINLSELYTYTVNWVTNHTNKCQDAQIYPEGSIFPIIEY